MSKFEDYYNWTDIPEFNIVILVSFVQGNLFFLPYYERICSMKENPLLS